MELKVDQPALAGQNIDPATFQRVWDRVMPNQASPRENTSIPDTAVPAVPTEPPVEQPEQPPAPKQKTAVPAKSAQPAAKKKSGPKKSGPVR